MDSNKISNFYKKLEQNGNITPTLKEKIKNEDDLRKIIENEIIPLAKKWSWILHQMNLWTMRNKKSKTLSDAEL